MERLPISGNSKILKYFLFLLVTALFIGILTTHMEIFFGALVLGVGAIFLSRGSKLVEFDENFMYVMNGEREEKIPLEKVREIKLSYVRINTSTLWQILYENGEGKVKDVLILPSNRNLNFEMFKGHVQEKNRKVVIRNWRIG